MSASIAVMAFSTGITPLARKRDCAEEFSPSLFGQRLHWRAVKPVEKLAQEWIAMVWHRLWISPDCRDGQHRRYFEQAATLFANGGRS